MMAEVRREKMTDTQYLILSVTPIGVIGLVLYLIAITMEKKNR